MNNIPPLTQLTEDEAVFRDLVGKFARESIGPHVAHMDETGKMERSVIDGAVALGLAGIEIPGEYGGSEGSFMMSVLAIEELAKVDPSVSVMIDVQNTLVNTAFLQWGSPALKKKYLPKLAGGVIASFGLSESSAGSDAFALKTRAEKTADGYLINGNKMWITNAGEAGVFIVFANLAPDKGYKGISAFIVERDFPGFSLGKREDKLGIRASSTCELVLENVAVPAENLLGEEGKGYKYAIEILNEGRIGIGAQMIGLAQGAFAYALDYAGKREQFGKPIASFQAVQHDLARMAVEIETARLLVYNAARLKMTGQPFRKEAAMAKYYASQVAESVASRSLEVLGGNGFIKEYPLEKFYRDAKIGKIYEGTSNMQLSQIAKDLLG